MVGKFLEVFELIANKEKNSDFAWASSMILQMLN
jgi:hypothetical protein